MKFLCQLNSDIWVTTINSSSYWDLIYPSVMVHSSASATITVAGKTFTSDASGNTQHSMPWGTFSISDSVSGQSFECTIGRDTTDVYVVPEGAVYWYGNECSWITGGIEFTSDTSNLCINKKNINSLIAGFGGLNDSYTVYASALTNKVIDLSSFTNVYAKVISNNSSAKGFSESSTKFWGNGVCYNESKLFSFEKTNSIENRFLIQGASGKYVFTSIEVAAIWIE